MGAIEPRKRAEDTIYAADAIDEELKSQIEWVFIGKHLRLDAQAQRLVDAYPERF